MSDLYEWALTATENNAPVPDGAPEGWPWRRLAETCRTVMGAAREWYDDPEWIRLVTDPVTRSDETTIRVSGVDVTSAFPIDSRIRMIAGPTAVDATIATATYSGGDTFVTVIDAEVPGGLEIVLLHSLSNWSNAAFREAGDNAGKILPYEDVLPLISERGTESTKSAITLIVASITSIPLNGGMYLDLTEADGVRELVATIQLPLSFVQFTTKQYVTAYVFLGVNGSFFDPLIYKAYLPLLGATDFPGTAFTQLHTLPNLSLGTPATGSRLSVWATRTGSYSVGARSVADAPAGLLYAYATIRRLR